MFKLTDLQQHTQRDDVANKAPATWGDGSLGAPHLITLASAPRNGGRQTYSVHFRGELIAVSRDPEFEACRLLLAAGYRGQLETWWAGGAHPAMRMDIATCAELATSDAASGLRIAKWRPFDLATPDD